MVKRYKKESLIVRLFWKIKNFFLSLFSRRTVGARALVIHEEKVLLVKHTYIPGWYTIGGGVEAGESGLQALIRELKEEAGIIPTQLPTLFGFYYNRTQKRNDYVAFYICKDFTKKEVKSKEILEARWFSLENLPVDISEGTKRRIDEYLGRQPLSDQW